MKAKDYRTKSETELNNELAELKKTLFNLRFQHTINQLENPMRINQVKKDIARVKTVLTEIEREDSVKGGDNA